MIRRALVAALCIFAASACSTRRDTHERLNGVLWMQTSAEYQALASMTFRQATEKVLALKKQIDAGRKVASAALEQPGANAKHLPPAVIVDIDETLLDNSPMSGELIEHRVGWDDRIWTDWVEMRRAEFIDGARKFVEKARAAGVEVFFVTNRKVTEQGCTVDDLRPLVVTDEQILAAGEKDAVTGEVWPNEKGSRRTAVARNYWVLALVGDDLADFLSGIREGVTPEQRSAAMQKHIELFGERWFLLPNPVYGSWEFAVVDPHDKDEDQLHDKHRKLRRFPKGDREPAPCGTPGGPAPVPGPSTPAS